MKRTLILLALIMQAIASNAEDGYKLWLRYSPVKDAALQQQYKKATTEITLLSTSATAAVIRQEFRIALPGMLGMAATITNTISSKTSLVAGIKTALPASLVNAAMANEKPLGDEGFVLHASPGKPLVLVAEGEKGLLYGTFHLLRLMQTGRPLQNLHVASRPQLSLRMLNHWDNLNRTVERGYAGFSIWNWHTLPAYIDQRYIDYARANASIGINAVSLTNVNANAIVLTPDYLQKVKALADVFRSYGIRVFLTARFSAPIEIGRLKTADPLNDSVRLFWKRKADEIYALIPDFGGFLVKANSEGQPGPQDYKRDHADGANVLAEAVAPHKGIIIWRAFVYNPESNDRFKQAYEEFLPLDGKFLPNVMVQVKNGPIDFQPREPISPLFGAMKKTPVMMEFQLTQEYTGQGTHLVYLAPFFREVLQTDTYQAGEGSTVQRVIDGSLYKHALNGMAAVSNIGTDMNWTSHPFAQANWYALGRMSWDASLTPAAIADEWVRQNFTVNGSGLQTLRNIMLQSHAAMVAYMTPVGLAHIMYNGHHYGPMPWGNSLNRPDWNPVYYHRADSAGLGFDRTAAGTNALAQYAPGLRRQYESMRNCPDSFLLWFHHVPWTHKMQSGRTLWEELCFQYNKGVDAVRSFQQQWTGLQMQVDAQRHSQVQQLLNIQLADAIWWRDACLSYFQTFSKMPIPPQYPQPAHSLDHYKSIRIAYAPGN
jgi:alpha-glucuronidase